MIAYEFITYEFITVEQTGTSPSGKTKIFSVRNRRSGDPLGDVRWFGPWRQYTFQPAPFCVFSAGCMVDIASFIQGIRR